VVEPKDTALKMAELTIELLEDCQNKQERIAESLNLTISEFKALRHFKENTTIYAGNLAKKMDISNSRLTRIVDGLVKKNLVQRDLSLSDRRVMELKLTKEGRRTFKTLNEKYLQIQIEIIQYLSPGSAESVLNSLMNLHKALKLWSKT
jgi:DNA-binding MarR family transcriptional regulator